MIALSHPAFTAAAIAFALTLALTPAVRALCTRLRIFDAPGPLKIHTHPIPRLGGAAIFIAVFATTIFAAPHRGPPIAAFLAALTLIWLAGFLDDLRSLSPTIRVAAQLAAGALICMGGWRISIFGSSSFGFVAICVASPAMCNAMNLFDGMDALASGTTAIIAIAYIALPHGALSPFGCVVAATVAASSLGFLPLNWPTGKLFLGDQGSTLLGFAIAFLGVDFLRASSSSRSALAFTLLVAAVPLLDAALAAIRRTRNQVSALRGDRNHIYGNLIARGYSVLQTLAWLYGTTAVLAVSALLLVYGPSAEIAVVAAALVGILISVAISLGSLKKEGVPGIANLPIGGFQSTSAPEKSTVL